MKKILKRTMIIASLSLMSFGAFAGNNDCNSCPLGCDDDKKTTEVQEQKPEVSKVDYSERFR
jgi:hypothetical protein